jgi:hypothetical protein
MEIETSTAVQFFFPSPSLPMVYFEAIANSLDAHATEIDIKISISAFGAAKTLEVMITDNGDGFTEENFSRFSFLMRSRDEQHKGLGRLVYLKYFDRVQVDSAWVGGRRSFAFDAKFKGESKSAIDASLSDRKTKLGFSGFKNEKIKSYDDLNPTAIKARVIEHFFPRLNEIVEKGGSFVIRVELETSADNMEKDFYSKTEIIGPEDLPKMTWEDIQDHGLDAISSIKMGFHVKSTGAKGGILTAVSVDGRTIPIDLVKPSAIPFGYSVIVLVSSDFLAGSADSSRQSLIVPEHIPEQQFFGFIRRKVGEYLSREIPKIKDDNRKTKVKFEEKFPHLLGLFEEETVGLIDKDDALNVAQARFFKVQKEVLDCEHLSDRAYEKSLELSSRTLTEYVLYREKIIGKMKEMSADNLEVEIHKLISPRYEIFSKGQMIDHVYRNNAWLLDDKFMSFQTILSESRMDAVIEEITKDESPIEDDGRPDITMIFSGDPDVASSVDVVVVELKKKTDAEKENQYAINQLLKRARRLVAHCQNIGRIWYYAVVEVDEDFEASLKQQRFLPVFSAGKVYYQEFVTDGPKGAVPTPVYVLSYDAVVEDARSRNHTFLEILRDGMRRYAEKSQ